MQRIPNCDCTVYKGAYCFNLYFVFWVFRLTCVFCSGCLVLRWVLRAVCLMYIFFVNVLCFVVGFVDVC